MRRYLLLCLLFPVAAAAQLPEVLTVEAGKSYSVIVQVTNKLIQQAEGHAIDFVTAGQAEHVLVTQDASKRSMQHQLKHLRFNFEGMGVAKSFDSQNSDDMEDELGSWIRPLTTPYQFSVSHSGKIDAVHTTRSVVAEDPQLTVVTDMVKELKSFADLPLVGSNGYFSAIIPAGTIKDQEWEEDVNGTKTFFRLTGITDSTYTLKYSRNEQDSSTADLNGINSVTKVVTDTEGTIIARRSSGMISRHSYHVTANGTREALGTRMPFSSRKTVTIIIRPQ